MSSRHQALSKPGSSTERVIETVLAQIADGTLGPGEQLRQEELAATLGISRVPVREGLHALAEEGVLTHRKHRGFFVAKRSTSELAQLRRLLELISREVLSTIEWPDHSVIAELRELNDLMRSLVDSADITETSRLNTAFHFKVFRLSPNHIMIDELERVWRLSHTYIIAGMATPESRRLRIREHEHIIAALAAHDRDGILNAHIEHRDRTESTPPVSEARPDRSVLFSNATMGSTDWSRS